MSSIEDEKLLLEALSKLTTSFAPLRGGDYYEAICRYVVEKFEFDYAYVGKLNSDKTVVDVLSGWAVDKPITTFSYLTKDTPCENTILYDYNIYPKDASKVFSKDILLNNIGIEAYSAITLQNKDQEPIGIFVALSKDVFKSPNLITHILSLYSGFLSSEMQRFAVEQSSSDLKHIAYYDPLTKLPNRLLITDRISCALANQKRGKNIVAICLLDLDGFKGVNDTLGHDAGDHVLVEVSKRIQKLIRPEDTVARLGGDEFVMVLSDIETSKDIAKVLQRVLNSISAPYVFKGKTINQISASIGVTIYPEDNEGDDTLIRHADQAMYKAKSNGKNQFYFFDTREHAKVRANVKTLKKIESAIDSGEFKLYFQPKLSAHNLQIESFEVLSRWEHPVLGTLSPSEFLPLIENDELVYKFDEWVMKESLEAIRKLRDEDIYVILSVNVSSKQFKQRSFIDKVKNIISDMELDYSYLHDIEFEITENSALESINYTKESIAELNKMGISFALDDFGTGYSSLTHLKELEVDTIKIDKMFIDEMLFDSQDMAIVNAIISLSKVFQIEVVAEGAENIEQLLMLLDLGCNYIQGYVVSKPMSYEDTLSYMKNYLPDPRLKIVSNNLPRRADFELLLAQSNHKYWIELVINTIKRRDFENIPQMSHESCRFGKWLKNNGKKYFSKYSSFNELVSVHKEVHKEVSMIIEKLNQNNYSAQDEDIKKIIELKNRLISVIYKLKDQYTKSRE